MTCTGMYITCLVHMLYMYIATESVNGWMDDRLMDGWMDGCMDGSMDGLKDGFRIGRY